jgi:beta-phosphoglucomutase-like phosphatase (HAD superfamily)
VATATRESKNAALSRLPDRPGAVERVTTVVDVELVIFDCDGVLVDSEVISNRVLAAMLSEQGMPTTLPQARAEYQGLLSADVLARAEAKSGRSFPAGWLAQYEAERAEAFRRELAPVAGASETVEELRAAGLKVCVASQGKLAKTRLSLALTGLDHLFPDRARFSAHAVANGKPAPDLFLHAAAGDGSPARRLRRSRGQAFRRPGSSLGRDARRRLHG